MSSKRYYAEEILKIIKEAEENGFWVDADWEEIRVGEPDKKYAAAALIGFNHSGDNKGWELA